MQLSGWPMSCRVPAISASHPALGLSTCTTVPWFYMCTRDRDSVPHVCRAVTLLQNHWCSLEFPFPFMYGGQHHQKIRRSIISLMMACRNISASDILEDSLPLPLSVTVTTMFSVLLFGPWFFFHIFHICMDVPACSSPYFILPQCVTLCSCISLWASCIPFLPTKAPIKSYSPILRFLMRSQVPF